MTIQNSEGTRGTTQYNFTGLQMNYLNLLHDTSLEDGVRKKIPFPIWNMPRGEVAHPNIRWFDAEADNPTRAKEMVENITAVMNFYYTRYIALDSYNDPKLDSTAKALLFHEICNEWDDNTCKPEDGVGLEGFKNSAVQLKNTHLRSFSDPS